MAESYLGVFRKRFHLMELGAALLAFYFTGILVGLFDTHVTASVSPFLAAKAFFGTSLTWLLFPIVFGILSGIGLFTMHKSWQEAQLEDKMGRNFKNTKAIQPYGEAHMEEPHEYKQIAQIRPLELCKGKILGQLEEDGDGRECVDFNPFDGRLNSHMVAIGTSGGGKTFTFVKPFMYQARKEGHSLVVSDPKGDLFRETSAYFRDNGYIVRQLNLKDLTKSDGWHVLKTLQGDNLSTNVKIFAQTIVSNITKENNVYSAGSNSLLCALLLRVLLGHDFPDEEKNIATVYQLLVGSSSGSDILTFLDTLFDKNAMTKEELPALVPYKAFKGSPNLATNIAINLASGLQILQDELLCNVLSTDDIDLTLLGQKPCVYYCQFPDSHDTYRFVVSLFFSMAFTLLLDYADLHTRNGKLPVPVDFLLDEFPALGIIPDWDRKMATVRSRGINCVMIIQDIPQLKMRYLESWKTILNNCGVVLTLGINEPEETARWISSRIGKTSIQVETHAVSKVAGHERHYSEKLSQGIGTRDLLSPDEVCKLSRDGTLILFTGHNPVYAYKTPHTIFADSQRHTLTLPEDIPPITDRASRRLRRMAEKAYLEEFWSSHDIHPNLRYADMSDALYAEDALSPMQLVGMTIKADIQTLKTLPHLLRARRAQATAKPETPAVAPPPAGNPLADAGAFKSFCDQWVADHMADDGAEETLSAIVNPTTGEVIDSTQTPVGASETPLDAPGDDDAPSAGQTHHNKPQNGTEDSTGQSDADVMLPIFQKKPSPNSKADRYNVSATTGNVWQSGSQPPAKKPRNSAI